MKVSGSKRISGKVSFSALWSNTFIACTIKTKRFNLKLNNASVPACAGIIRSSNIWCCFSRCGGGSCRINNVNAENWLKPNKFARYVIQYLPTLIVKSELWTNPGFKPVSLYRKRSVVCHRSWTRLSNEEQRETVLISESFYQKSAWSRPIGGVSPKLSTLDTWLTPQPKRNGCIYHGTSQEMSEIRVTYWSMH